MVFLSFSVFSLFFCVFLCFSTFFYVFSMLFLAFLCFSVFRQYPSSGSFGGQVWGPRCIFFVYSSTTIWALFAKQQGHQIASIITTWTRTDEEPCIPGPLCSCTDTALFGTLLPAGSSDFGGPPRAYFLFKLPRFRRHRNLARFCEIIRRRELPTLHSRAHPQDYGRRTTPSNYYYFIIIIITIIIIIIIIIIVIPNHYSGWFLVFRTLHSAF